MAAGRNALAGRALLGLDTPQRKVVFWSYLALWCALKLTVYGSQHSPSAPAFSPAALLVLTCLLKLAAAVWMTAAEEYDPCAPRCSGCRNVLTKTRESSGLCLRYLLPAASYAVYDNLIFWNLARLDPATYGVLMQLRILVTALAWQTVFARRLTLLQWAGMGLITVACVLQKLHGAGSTAVHPGVSVAERRHANAVGVAGVLLQIACGVFSSIYNEKMLKKGDISLNLQNVYMYSYSVLCNFAILAATGQFTAALSAFHPGSFLSAGSGWVLAVAGLMSAIGIVTSLFLKHLDSVTKTIASAIELFGDAFLAWFFFGIPVNGATGVALVLASGGIVAYSAITRNPQHPETPANADTIDV
eukprot:TRINITY_DN65098_c0_g1_i1.p1 TRINITY_DN65098_c0_g1~~TRINITY_DN65098_c0_g1_i1.p1  ORF type:complete len:392 (+),score=149.22 TRINITY_DN65098_c0_g1_i1:97-1176(+)